MLGSLSEAEEAVQETRLRLARSDSGDIDNLGGWLTTVVGRVCLDMLRTRKARREESLIAPIVDRTPVAAGKPASRARQRVRGAAPNPDPDRLAQLDLTHVEP